MMFSYTYSSLKEGKWAKNVKIQNIPVMFCMYCDWLSVEYKQKNKIYFSYMCTRVCTHACVMERAVHDFCLVLNDSPIH
jgi:hypothetical protein